MSVPLYEISWETPDNNGVVADLLDRQPLRAGCIGNVPCALKPLPEYCYRSSRLGLYEQFHTFLDVRSVERRLVEPIPRPACGAAFNSKSDRPVHGSGRLVPVCAADLGNGTWEFEWT
jgi:hypothetical protein